ncbi:MAG: hypothetical protein JWP49_1173 [Phenylobacterium sp.]|nr:hypothetical protein [Phenylobacterium sp.]
MRPSVRLAVLAGLLAVSGGLAGCSHTGPLGHGAGAANQERQQAGPNAPTQTIDPRNASANPAPPRTLPIQGSGSDPFASGPPGALPDPYANPPR